MIPYFPLISQPKLAPSWIVSWVLKSGMGSIFARMKAVCRDMAQGDDNQKPKGSAKKRYPHVARLSSKEYAHVVNDLTGRVDKYLSRMGWA